MKHSIVAVLVAAAIWAGIWPAMSAENSIVGTWQLKSFSLIVLDTKKKPTAPTATIRQDIFSILPAGTWLCSLPQAS